MSGRFLLYNEAVCFDSIFEGYRGLYIVNLD